MVEVTRHPCAPPGLIGWRVGPTPPPCPPEAEIVNQSSGVGGRVFLLPLDDLLHDDIEAGVGFDGVPIGIRDGLAEEGRDGAGPKRPQPLRQSGLRCNRPAEYGGSYLSKKSGAVQDVAGPTHPFDPFTHSGASGFQSMDALSQHAAILSDLPRGADSRIVAVPAIGLLIELYCWGWAGAFACFVPLFFGACGKQTGSRFFLSFGNRFRNGNRFVESYLRFYFASDFRLRHGSTAPSVRPSCAGSDGLTPSLCSRRR